MSPKQTLILAVAAIVAVVGLNSFYVVNETQLAVKKRFGRIVEADIAPGFYGKVPVMDQVVKVDARTLVHDVPTQSFITAEKKLVNVDSFVLWRIVDVQRYLTVLGGGSTNTAYVQSDAELRLDKRVENALRDEFSKRTVQEVVAGERSQVMDEVAKKVNEGTVADLGLEIVDIRVKQVDWPSDVRDRVFDRMRAERARDAAEHRARGKEEAEKIRADADRQRTVLLAEAYRDSQLLRGEGDAKAAAVYAQAYNRDPEFFRFYRSLQAYRESLSSSSDLLVLEPDSDFFRYLKKSAGK